MVLALEQHGGGRRGLGRELVRAYGVEGALEDFKAALEFAEELNDREAIGNAYKGIGKVYIKTGEDELATEHLNKAIKQYTDAGAKAKLEEAQELLANIGGEENE